MNFVEYKFGKALTDNSRLHEAMMAACSQPPLHDHLAPTEQTVNTVRYIADDLLSDIGNCWDKLVNETLSAQRIPADRPRANGQNGKLSLEERIDALVVANAAVGTALRDLKDRLFERLKDARNDHQHNSFWTHTFEMSFPGDSPWLVDMRWPTDFGLVAVMRDSRRGLHTLYAFNVLLGTPYTLAAPNDPCEHCFPDRWLQQGNILHRLEEI